ncbi:echinoderm microtubule-associated protein-like 2 [Centruroides sculpturatus]|uniref:echinoderm microtubule-associated protein-like 2 n=1 Tax=Centruroides sculpturatus TaxID=218467 RepID=UPI000C6CA05E|nr:echinoderm microtubule-associated protein-like 2 [Centruroides sculpturatus]
MEDGEILNNDSESLQDRIIDLEKKIQEQADEIVCLRSTLADVLRRVTQLEGRAPVITSINNSVPVKISNSYRPGSIPYHRQSFSGVSGLSGVNSHHASTNSSQNSRPLSHYPSTSSLHSDSSASVSPIPSPLPTQTVTSVSTSSPRHTPSPNRYISASTSNLSNMKKWTSQELGSQYLNRSATSGSLYNLHIRPSRHGTKEAVLNQEDGTIKMYLYGKPFVMHIPTEYLQDYNLSKVNSIPVPRLKLEWVYGYRGRDCRTNLYLLPTGEIVYFIATVVVLYNVEDQIQRHYLGHTDDIKCLTIHPNKLLIATGQLTSLDKKERRYRRMSLTSTSVTHWVSVFNIKYFTLVSFFNAFCNWITVDGGSQICVIDNSPEHTISLWDWQKSEKGSKITETKCSSETVLAVEFHPMDRYTIITLGKGHVYFWDTEGGTLAKKIGIFEKHEKPKYVLCMAFTELGDLLTGDSNGNIMMWTRGANRVSRTLYNIHEGGVFTICSMKDGTYVTGGGKDRRIVEWDHTFSKTGREAKLPEQVGGVRGLAQGKGNLLLVGTIKNCILQGTFSLNFSVIVQGHKEEIWALAVHPFQNQFLSGGFDNHIHLWDSMSHSVIWTKDIGHPIRSACFSPDGNILILATTSGQWMAMDATTRQIYFMHTDGVEPVSCVKFSPDGHYLAVGSHDNHVYVYQVDEDYKKYHRIGRCVGHSNLIVHIDWSEDSTYIQTTSGDHELLYWNASVCRPLTNMSIARDVKWKTHNCTHGFFVFGIWPENLDGTDINACDRSNNCKLLVTGDDAGKIKLYTYPACQPKCLHHIYCGHSSYVTAIGFLQDDARIISLGGRDWSILQWMII